MLLLFLEFFLLVAALQSPCTPGFLLLQQVRGRDSCTALPFGASTDADDDVEMKDLIAKLAATASDEKRRGRLAEIFQQKIGTADFATRFEATLMAQGAAVQEEAKAAATAEMQPGAEDEEKSHQKRLWALVDMMVQSKVLIKEHKQKLKGDETG